MAMRRFMAGAAGGLVIAFGAGHIGTLQAQTTSVNQAADQQLTNRVAAGNLLEVRLGQTAQEKSSNPSVKQFGQRMEADHTTMQKLWMAMASKNGLEFKAATTPDQVAQYEQLKKLSGADFDRAYMGVMVQNHRNNLSALQNERSLAHAPDVLSLVNQDLSTVQTHLTMAQQIAGQVGADVSGSVATGTDTTPIIPTIPTRTDTTVVTQNPRQTNEDLSTQGNIKADAQFIRDVDASHFLQVRLGRLAQKKGRDADVKRFGKEMEQEHSAFLKQWSDMASRNGMKFKSGMGKEHQADLKQLEKASSQNFDRAYMTFMIQSHNAYVNYWRKEGRGAHSAAVRQLVNAGLPTLEQDLNAAKRIGKQVGVNAEAALAGRRVAAQ